MVEIHTAGSLHDGFEDEGCQLRPRCREEVSERLYVRRQPFATEATLRLWQEILYGQCSRENAVHTGNGIAYAHGVPDQKKEELENYFYIEKK